MIHGWAALWPQTPPTPGSPSWMGLLSTLNDAGGLVVAAACLLALLLLQRRNSDPERIGRVLGTLILIGVGLVATASVTMTANNLDSVGWLTRHPWGLTLVVASSVVLGLLPVLGWQARRAGSTRA